MSCNRFVSEISEHVDAMNKNIPDNTSEIENLSDGTIMKNGSEICKDHGAKLDYYCSTCKVPICSECAMFEAKHKDHKYLRMAEVYQKHVEVIEKEAQGLKKRLKELNNHTSEVQKTIEKVTKAQEEKSKEIENFVENI